MGLRRKRRGAGTTNNTFAGMAHNVVQVGTVHGDITFTSAADIERLPHAAESLATAVHEQWELEAATRSLHRPQPLRLRWSAATHDQAGGALGGDLDDIVADMRRSPGERLVVLGEPGSGKTVLALLLTLELLNRRAPGDPVPVLFTVSSWDPHIEHLHSWMARRLEQDYKALVDHRAYGRDAALRMIRSGLVLPILDGLDELPEGLHVRAIEGIDHAAGTGKALVVTCRSREYETAVAAGGTELSSATVIELDPVEPGTAIEYLATGPAASAGRWAPVFAQLREQPSCPLAIALTTPLMVHLARVAYHNPATDPRELLDRGRFDTPRAVERHLLDAFVPATYNDHPPAPVVEAPAVPARRYPPTKAQRWLSFLAADVLRRRTREFAWWELPGQRVMLSAALAIAFLSRGINPLLTHLLTGFYAATMVGLLDQAWRRVWERSTFEVISTVVTPKPPRQISFRVAGRMRPILGSTLSGLFMGTGVGFLLQAFGVLAAEPGSYPWWAAPLSLTLLGGVLLGLGSWLTVPSGRVTVPRPDVVLRQDRWSTLLWMLLAVIATFCVTLVVNALSGLPWLSVAAGEVGITVLFGVGFGLGFAWTGAWSASLLPRMWWALTGKLPWRLMRFLDDAHQRGVLRQAGPRYQFRHARLQDRLAGVPEEEGTQVWDTEAGDFTDPADNAEGWSQVTAKHGLPHNWVYDLFQDSKGRMWVATWGGGVAMWERGKWQVFTRDHGLANNVVSCIREDRAGRIWVGTDSGLSRWDGAVFVDAGLSGKRILNIDFDRSDRLWVGCWRMRLMAGGGLHMFDGTTWHAFSGKKGMPSRDILNVFEDSRGMVWVGSYERGRGGGVSCWDGDTWRTFTTRDGLAHDCVYSIAEDAQGRLWFGTIDGVSVLDGDTWQRFSTADGLVNNRVYTVFVDSHAYIWLGTHGGVSRFDGTSWLSFTREYGLTANLTRTIAEDSSGRMWFGAYPATRSRGGIARMTHRSARSLD